MSRPQASVLIASTCLVLSTLIVLSRYYESAGFERPIHLSLVVLAITSTVLYAWAGTSLHRIVSDLSLRLNDAYGIFQAVHGVARTIRTRRVTLPSINLPCLLVVVIVSRTIIFWRTIRTIHCSWDGLQSFVPFFVAVLEHPPFRRILSAKLHDALSPYSNDYPPTRRYILIALAWAAAASYTYSLTETRTGVLCPLGFLERLTPFLQFVMTFLDSLLLVLTARLYHSIQDQNHVKPLLGNVLSGSAAALGFLSFWGLLGSANFRWGILISAASWLNIIFEGAFISCALISGMYLLSIMGPAFVATLFAATTVFGHILLCLQYGTLANVWWTLPGAVTGLIIFLGLVSKFDSLLSTGLSPASGHTWFRESKIYGLTLLAFFITFGAAFVYRQDTPHPNAIGDLITTSRLESSKWISAAKQSTTLEQAVHEYKQRYGMPPPPNFDKWYTYATSLNSPIIDDFTQIHQDLLPFWGLPPQLIRLRTTHLLEHPTLSVGGLIIRNGQINISPHVHGTHRWMLDYIQTMIEPFAQWLPDMQLAFNLDDECRLSVPFQDLEGYQAEGVKARSRLASSPKHTGLWSTRENSWSYSLLALDESQTKNLWKKKSPFFQDWSKSPIFSEWVSRTCSSDAKINRRAWWNRKAKCPWCAAPHTTGGIVSNWTLSGDLCHQPDLAYLHGFLSSPSALVATHSLFPIFSQSRVSSFSDILYPSPWNFGDKVQFEEDQKVTWPKKLNSVFWRGASSDGFAMHGSWQSFLRARFVHQAQRLRSILGATTPSKAGHSIDSAGNQDLTPNHSPITLDVSFVGNFSRCDGRDCAAESAIFYGSPTAKPPDPIDFQEHWKYRHLFDLDGAGFSGRFLPFLQSGSLPYRAALFRTWWEERVHAWRHFVPVDTRLHELHDVVSFLGGRGAGEAATIATDGSEWAKRALRKEDMQIYMFRLLLEWGRVVDDQREELGFVLE
ncbi:hypothetical protein F5Y16DRAFT_264240 [Xylariaceae sp. FL0255]|nr:hypothetical protein F5Y16DRAFT_264240 [Xylariaceae sp. FL0255]